MKSIFSFTNRAGDTTRRATWGKPPSWAVLAGRIASVFDIPEERIVLLYVDFDGEEVTMDSEQELQDYYKHVVPRLVLPDTHAKDWIMLRFIVADRAAMNIREKPLDSLACGSSKSALPEAIRRPVPGRSRFMSASASQQLSGIASRLLSVSEFGLLASSLPQATPGALTSRPSSAFLSLSTVPPQLPYPTSSATFNCGICMEDQDKFSRAFVDSCYHEFCRDCIRQYIRTKIQERQYPIPCPACAVDTERTQPGRIGAGLIRSIGLTTKESTEFTELELASVSTSISCRRCGQSTLVDLAEYNAVKVITCPLPGCDHTWCKACSQPVDPHSHGPTHRCGDGTAELRQLMDTQGWMYCPGCNTPASKISGCNAMRCGAPGCYMRFCYRCKGIITKSTVTQDINAAKKRHYETCNMWDPAPVPQTRNRNNRLRDDRPADEARAGGQPRPQRLQLRGNILTRLRRLFVPRRRA